MPTARIRTSRSYSSISRRRPFHLNTSKSSTFNNTGSNGSSSENVTTRIPKKFISKELILLDAFLKKKSTSIVRRMLAIDNDAPQTDVESISTGSESDDDVTLVAVPFVKELEGLKKGFTAERLDAMPSVMLGKKICDYHPDYSDNEDDGAGESNSLDEQPAIEEASDTITNSPPSPPPCPINFWSPRNEIFDAPGFEIVKDDDRIVYATPLSPPPWYRPKQSMLLYEPASPDDEIPCPTNSEPPVHALFSW